LRHRLPPGIQQVALLHYHCSKLTIAQVQNRSWIQNDCSQSQTFVLFELLAAPSAATSSLVDLLVVHIKNFNFEACVTIDYSIGFYIANLPNFLVATYSIITD
jgi:hypothetical protein